MAENGDVAPVAAAAEARSSYSAKKPEDLDLSDPEHNGENWKKFARTWKKYEDATGLSEEKSHKRRSGMLRTVVGDDGLDVLDAFQWENEEDKIRYR